MPGYPPSEQSATSLPSARSDSTFSVTRSSLPCLYENISAGRGISKCVRSCHVRRVSSQAIAAAPLSASIARGERSARFPIGVATTWSMSYFAEAVWTSICGNGILMPAFSSADLTSVSVAAATGQ